ncbi:winged helix-turn-helix transcriptional regulator [Noviherbaspirillum saxi]|uniref:Transcriptional regulator n=1 Tax=Noviherbaspirillum saxi TaxID=2320863 RepID=A0A3A3FT06_9BURK|nr:helix-turn-helix domain-containing protein [Noviherbaspirillum saxi]RJF98650.1 transcriptional regulator [Noviherbaspirillum saxi]
MDFAEFGLFVTVATAMCAIGIYLMLSALSEIRWAWGCSILRTVKRSSRPTTCSASPASTEMSEEPLFWFCRSTHPSGLLIYHLFTHELDASLHHIVESLPSFMRMDSAGSILRSIGAIAEQRWEWPSSDRRHYLTAVTILFIVNEENHDAKWNDMKRSDLADRYCSIARAGAALTDGWSFVILKEIFLSNTRFDGLQMQTGMSPRSLTLRLNSLVEAGILNRVSYQESPVRYEYRPTVKGIELWPALVALKEWGDKWSGPWKDEDPPLILHHKACGHRLELGFICKACKEPVDAYSSRITMTPGMREERDQFTDKHRKAVRTKRSEAARALNHSGEESP